MASEATKTTKTNGPLKRLEDIKSLDELDFDKLDLVIGDTPDDIKDQCLQLCKDYLSGIWCRQTLDTIEVRRVSGGLTNQLYYCGLKVRSDSKPGVPQEVAIRLYGEKVFMKSDVEGNDRLTDVVISLVVSQNKLGPKVYGVFPTGQITQYYQHRQFTPDEQKDLELVREVFQKLARIHAMDVPLRRSHNWLFTEFDLFKQWLKDNNGHQLLVDYKCETFKSCNFETEIEFIKSLTLLADSPIVYTHNDYRSSNLMITSTPNTFGERIVVCDFEYSGYGYRGMDFIHLSREWGRKQWDFSSVDGMPQPNHVMDPLIQIYLKECQQIHGNQFTDNPINSVEHIGREIKLFVLIAQFFFAFMMLKGITSRQKFDKNMIMQLAEQSYKHYLTLKDRLKDLHLIN